MYAGRSHTVPRCACVSVRVYTLLQGFACFACVYTPMFLLDNMVSSERFIESHKDVFIFTQQKRCNPLVRVIELPWNISVCLKIEGSLQCLLPKSIPISCSLSHYFSQSLTSVFLCSLSLRLPPLLSPCRCSASSHSRKICEINTNA